MLPIGSAPASSLIPGGVVRRSAEDLRAALDLTGWFLAAHIFAGASVPPARERFIKRLARDG